MAKPALCEVSISNIDSRMGTRRRRITSKRSRAEEMLAGGASPESKAMLKGTEKLHSGKNVVNVEENR